MRYLEPLAYVALLLAALLACGGGEAPKAKPADLTPMDVCAKLVTAKVARDCVETGATADVVGVSGGARFTVVGIANYEGTIRQYGTEQRYQEWKKNETDRYKTRAQYEKGGVPADDYPELSFFHGPSRMIIDWGPPTSAASTDTEIDRWEACRTKQAVAACAKARPQLYTATKALYEAAKRAVGAK